MELKKRMKTCTNGHIFYKSSACSICPICEKDGKPTDHFLSNLSAPARRALLSHGISDLAQLSTWSEKEILALHGIGKSAIPIIKKLLETQQLSFKIEND